MGALGCAHMYCVKAVTYRLTSTLAVSSAAIAKQALDVSS
jgi:hypothetical protein